MGSNVSTARMHVVVSVPARSAVLLNRFFQEDPQELTILHYFEMYITPHLKPWDTGSAGVGGQMKYELATVLIRLVGEEDDIEVSSLNDLCSDYLAMGMKKVTFYLKLIRVQSGPQSERSPKSAEDSPEDSEDDYECNDQHESGLNDKKNSEYAEKEEAGRGERSHHGETTPSSAVNNKRRKQQKSLGAFFGSLLRKEYARDESGRKVLKSSSLVQLEENVQEKVYVAEVVHCRFCNKEFNHCPARVQHEKACELKFVRRRFEASSAAEDASESDEGLEGNLEEPRTSCYVESAAGSITTPLHEAAACPDNAGTGGNDAEGPEAHETDGEVAAVEDSNDRNKARCINVAGRKMLKSGKGFKRSGLREGMKRGTMRTIHFKYAVVQYYRKMQERKKLGLVSDAGNATVAHFGGITNGQISGWAKLEDKLCAALVGANQPKHRGKRTNDSELLTMKSKAARKFTLHPGSARKYAAAEAEVHAMYKELRAKGARINGHFLRIQMKRCMSRIYGQDVLQHFKASHTWLAKFARHYNMSLRRITNKKNMSVEERSIKCRRWHARYRRRLKRGKQLHPKWGRWLPEDRISLDQVRFTMQQQDTKKFAPYDNHSELCIRCHVTFVKVTRERTQTRVIIVFGLQVLQIKLTYSGLNMHSSSQELRIHPSSAAVGLT